MFVLNVRNAHQALPIAIDFIQQVGVPRGSRYGDVLMASQPVTTCYHKPDERVMFWPERDANPFFHFMECLWMMAGRNDVAFLTTFAKKMAEFSDDGKTFHGAYGYRWRKHFGFDQLALVIERLRNNKDDRRQMLGIWDVKADLENQNTKDIPCNTIVHFQVSTDGKLDMTVFNRSNDIIWGCYGANAVHFSFLHEYVARCVGVELGVYRQISDNWHGYRATLDPLLPLGNYAPDCYSNTKLHNSDPYAQGQVKAFPIINTDEKVWNQDLEMFLEDSIEYGYRDVFFRRVAMPLLHAHRAYKKKQPQLALEILEQCAASDWALACKEWIERRIKNETAPKTQS